MKISRAIFAVVWLVLGMARAGAALTISLDAPAANAATGTAVIFTGTLTNTSATAKVFLNDVQCVAPAGLALRPNTFFANVPGILLPGEIYTGPIFSAVLGAVASPGDYACTLAMKGGADIVAADELATAVFTVLSPVVSVAATVPGAFEFGPVSGAFTVTRSGATMIPLAVPFTIGGSAANGTDFATVTSPVVIPTGAAAADVPVVPIPNNIAQGNRTCVLTLSASGTANIGASAAATVIIHDRPIDLWRFNQFGAAANTPAASDTASWAGDGVANLIKFATAFDPRVSNVAVVPRPALMNGYLTLSFVPNPDATDVSYVVESTTDFTSWGTSELDLITLSPVRTYRYRHPVSEGGRAFLRLKVERLP